MAKSQHLQDPFLNACRKEKVEVSIFLVNGVKLVGQISSFDQFIIILSSNNSGDQMVYKHAISTIKPEKKVNYQPHSNDDKQ